PGRGFRAGDRSPGDGCGHRARICEQRPVRVRGPGDVPGGLRDRGPAAARGPAGAAPRAGLVGPLPGGQGPARARRERGLSRARRPERELLPVVGGPPQRLLTLTVNFWAASHELSPYDQLLPLVEPSAYGHSTE